MAYRSLEKLFHMNVSSDRYGENDRLAAERLMAESTFRTGFEAEVGEFFLAVPRELSALNESVLRAECAISCKLAELPPIARGALVRGLVIDEVVCTNNLEGVHSTRRQINDLLEKNTAASHGAMREKRFKELANLYLELSDESHVVPRDPADIRAIYDKLMQGEDMTGVAPDGLLFRKEGVDVIGSGGKVLHRGLEPEGEIIAAMRRMLDLANSPDMPATYAAMTAHYLFEYAHPFYDGNGRCGRYLLSLYLARALSPFTALSLSRVIAEQRSRYYRLFKETESKLNHGELTMFVYGMLDYVRVAQEELVTSVDAQRALLEQVGERLDVLVGGAGLSELEGNVVFQLAQVAIFGVFPDVLLEEVADHIGLKSQMARKYMRRLEEKGLVATIGSRPLRFVLTPLAQEQLGL